MRTPGELLAEIWERQKKGNPKYYKPLEDATEREALHELYARSIARKQLPPFLLAALMTDRGSLIATGYDRIVIGDYGAYLEIDKSKINFAAIRRRWDKEPTRPVKYIWWEPIDGAAVTIYEQRRTVSYADYVPGKWYVSPSEILISR